jgi:hypothetical protein
MVGAGFYGGRGVGTTLYSGFNPPMPRGQGTQSGIPAPQQGNPYPQTGGVPPADPGVVYPDLYVNAPGYDNSAAIRDLYNSLQRKGRKIYRSTKGELKGIYSDLEAAYAPRQENTRATYEGAINLTNAERDAGDAAAAMRSSAEDAARRDMLARMGIGNEADTGSGGGSVDMAREQGASTRGALQQNWSGLMGALSTAQQGRDASALLGVGDQQTMALEELSTRWSDYRQSLAEREAEAMKSARGGGGKMLNPEYQGLPELLKNAQIQQFANKTNQSVEDVIAQMGGNQSQGIDPGVARFGLDALAEWSTGNKFKVPESSYLSGRFQQEYGDNYVPYLQNWYQYDPRRASSYSN